jgi:hypothetical protein
MDSWPCDVRNANQASSGSKEDQPDHPHLQQGMVGAVTLVEKNGRLDWSFLRTNSGAVLRIFQFE